MQYQSRKKFIASAVTATTAFLLAPKQLFSAGDDRPQMSTGLVKEFVGTSHRNMERVVEMHREYPTLLNCAWDWGGGDFETALGAASHVGYIELVQYLVEHGAQMNFLTLCLLGKLDHVKALLNDYPYLLNMKGPHGFTPLHHAINGGENALPVKEYLESLGAVETKIQLQYK